MATVMTRPQPATDDSTAMPSSVPIKKIDRKNRMWAFYSDAWEMLSVLYEGGVRLRQNVDKFIVRRPKELYDVFYERIRRLTYQDILQACISWYISKMFQREPTITDKDNNKDFVEFLSNCNRSGTTFIKFTSEILETMMLYRTAFVLVDKPNIGTAEIVTRQDEIDIGIHIPYLTVFDPRSVINWKMDRYNNLEFIVIKTVTEDQDGPVGPISILTHWWVFDKQNYYHYEFKSKIADGGEGADLNGYFQGNKDLSGSNPDTLVLLKDSGPHSMAKFDKVPIKVCSLPMHLWHANRAFLHLLEHVDTMNAYSWKLFMANLPILTIFTDEEASAVVLSEAGYLKFQSKDRVEWLEPQGSTFQESRAHLSTMRQEIYRSFHLQAQGKDSTATADGSSGYSKEVEMAPSVDVLNAFGDLLRADMQSILIMAKQSAGMGLSTPDVSGFQFETHPVIANLTKFQAAADSGIIQKSRTLEDSCSIDIAMDLVDGKNEETKDKIRTEITASPSIKEYFQELGTGDGKPPKVGPGANIQTFQERDSRAQAANILRAEGQTS